MFSQLATLVLVCTSLALVSCEPPLPNNQYGTPLGTPISSYGTPNYDANNHDHGEYGEPKGYEFGYQVKDDYSGNNYNRKEQSDGNQVRGEYRVALPDGRTQIVTYWADWQTGFHADVKYEGEAQYPEQYNTNNNNNNRYNQGPSNQYGTPNYNNGYNNNNGGGYNHQGHQGFDGGYASGSSSVQTGGYNNNYNNGYDGYNSGFGSKRPSNEYGAP